MEWRREYGRRYYAKNAAVLCERQKSYRRADPAKNASVKQAWAEANPDYARNWRLANPEAVAVYHAKRRARRVSAGGTFSAQDVAAIRVQQKDRCAYCRVGLNNRGHVDHIVPLARGGSNWPRNIQLLCQPCNQRKKDRDPVEYARSTGRLL